MIIFLFKALLGFNKIIAAVFKMSTLQLKFLTNPKAHMGLYINYIQ